MDRDLPWAKWWGDQCRARKEPNNTGFWGRCELKKRHTGDHALERGMEILRWSTNWTNDGEPLYTMLDMIGLRRVIMNTMDPLWPAVELKRQVLKVIDQYISEGEQKEKSG